MLQPTMMLFLMFLFPYTGSRKCSRNSNMQTRSHICVVIDLPINHTPKKQSRVFNRSDLFVSSCCSIWLTLSGRYQYQVPPDPLVSVSGNGETTKPQILQWPWFVTHWRTQNGTIPCRKSTQINGAWDDFFHAWKKSGFFLVDRVALLEINSSHS